MNDETTTYDRCQCGSPCNGNYCADCRAELDADAEIDRYAGYVSACAACPRRPAAARCTCWWCQSVAGTAFTVGNTATPHLTPMVGRDDLWPAGDYLAYVSECEAEECEPHSLHMWKVHGSPAGPI